MISVLYFTLVLVYVLDIVICVFDSRYRKLGHFMKVFSEAGFFGYSVERQTEFLGFDQISGLYNLISL